MKRRQPGRTYDLTGGAVVKTLVTFALPMILGNLLQQVYNITDTLIVGKVLGRQALAAVGSAYTLMTFLTSLIIGLCMGCGALFSYDQGAGDHDKLERDVYSGVLFCAGISLGVFLLVWGLKEWVLIWMQVPEEVRPGMEAYLEIIYPGLIFTFLYNFFAFLLRALGNSKVPLYFLGAASLLNVILDLLFVIGFGWEIRGAASATVLAQGGSGVGLMLYTLKKVSWIRIPRQNRVFNLRELKSYCLFTCLQQSVMNFGILMIQGLVNTFGTVIMAAFTAGVKIDTLAYMPAQEFGNAYSLFVSQNYGAGRKERIAEGTQKSFIISTFWCLLVSGVIYLAAPYLMKLFTNETAVVAAGVRYLRIEGACYFGIGCLFLWYGYFRGIGKPAYSLVLTIVSLGTRVLLAYLLAPKFGVIWIWWAIVIGWILADIAGMIGKRVLKNEKSV